MEQASWLHNKNTCCLPASHPPLAALTASLQLRRLLPVGVPNTYPGEKSFYCIANATPTTPLMEPTGSYLGHILSSPQLKEDSARPSKAQGHHGSNPLGTLELELRESRLVGALGICLLCLLDNLPASVHNWASQSELCTASSPANRNILLPPLPPSLVC